MFLFLNIGILYLSGENFRFLLLFFLHYSCKRRVFIYLLSFFSNLVCWVRGNFSGGPGHVYILCLYLSAVGLAGRYNFIWSQWWSGRRDCTIFLLFWLYSGGYSTGEMVRGGGPFFPLFSFSLLSVLLADEYW